MTANGNDSGGNTPLSHLNDKGEANMVDVSAKQETRRIAVATARLRMQPATLKEILHNGVPKGDVLAVARVAGIQGAKRCADLIPLCHPLALSKVQVDFDTPDDTRLLIRTAVTVTGKTGVEMEALTAASITAAMAAVPAERPSMLSRRLKALVIPTTHKMVNATFSQS